MQIPYHEYECPYCEESIQVQDCATNGHIVTCAECIQTSIVNRDAEFIDSSWRDRTALLKQKV